MIGGTPGGRRWCRTRSSGGPHLDGRDGLIYDDLVQLYRTAGIGVVPTIAYSSFAVRLNEHPDLLDRDSALAPFLPPRNSFAWMGVGAGPSVGWIAGEPSVTALHTRARLWGRIGAATYSVSAEPTRFLGAWFTDVSAAVTLFTGRIVTSLWGARRLSTAFGSKSAASVLLQVFPASNLAIEIGGGSYLPEPYQGLPRASYGTVGIRVFAANRRPAAQPAARAPRWPPLIPERRGDSVVVRFRMEGAAAVAIAGDWDDWQPRDLRSSGSDLWVGALALWPGTYHFNLLVDHKDWVVPGGVAISDGLGGLVGVLVVP